MKKKMTSATMKSKRNNVHSRQCIHSQGIFRFEIYQN